MKPVQLDRVGGSPISHEWQPVIAKGKFDVSTQILLRNHYSDGVYGFELLTQFTDLTGRTFWVDRGWVKAGKNASTQPDLPGISPELVSITGRLRLDTSLPRGSFFAIPTDSKSGLIAKANAQSGNLSSDFYLDLLSGNLESLTPPVPAELPELSDGPHMAYAIQWVFFGGLICYGRSLIRREVLTRKEL